MDETEQVREKLLQEAERCYLAAQEALLTQDDTAFDTSLNRIRETRDRMTALVGNEFTATELVVERLRIISHD